MRKTLVVLVAIILIGSINSYAAFPTFVWTEEYRSRLYAVEIMNDTAALGSYSPVIEAAASDAEEDIVSDALDDDPATPTDLDTASSYEGMNIAGDGENEPDSVAESITSYDIEFEIEDGMETIVEDPEDKDTQEEHNIEPEEEG